MLPKDKKIVNLAKLAKEFGYTRDHLAYLCRKGEVRAVRAGRVWQTSREEVKKYKLATQEVQKQRWDEMSAKSKLDKVIHISPKPTRSEVAPRVGSKVNFQKPVPAAPRAVRVYRLTFPLNHALAYAVQRVEPWASFLAGSLDVAGRSFQFAGRLMFVWPLKALMSSSHLTFRAVYWIFYSPVTIFSKTGRLFRIAVRPAYEIYDGKTSLHKFIEEAARARAGAQAVIGIFIAVIWVGASAGLFGVSTGEMGRYVASRARETISSHADIRPPNPPIWGNSNTLLVRDYQVVQNLQKERVAIRPRMDESETQSLYSDIAGQVAGAVQRGAPFYKKLLFWAKDYFADLEAEWVELLKSRQTGEYVVVEKSQIPTTNIQTKEVIREIVLRDIQVIERSKPGPVGPVGPRGARGETGERGKDGISDLSRPPATLPTPGEGLKERRNQDQGQVAGISAPSPLPPTSYHLPPTPLVHYVGAPAATVQDGAGYAGSIRYFSAGQGTIDEVLKIGPSSSQTTISGTTLSTSIISAQDATFTNATTTNLVVTAGGTFNSVTTTDTIHAGGRLTVAGTATSTVAGSFVVDTDTFFVNANENRVGIGTASPTTTLGVVGSFRVNGASTFTGDTTIAGANFTLFPSSNAANVFRLQDASQNNVFSLSFDGAVPTTTIAGSLVVDANTLFVNGNENRVGIGTVSPTSTFEVAGSGNFWTDLRTGGQLTVIGTSSFTGALSGSSASFSGAFDAQSVSVSAGLTAGSATTTDSLYVGGKLTVGGNVGIGTDSPTSTLSVVGNSILNGTLRVGGATTLDGNTIIATDNTYDLGASGATRFRTGYFGTSVIVGSTITITTNTIESSGALSLNTTNNQAITTGTGLFTAGGNLDITGRLAVNSATASSTIAHSFLVGNTTLVANVNEGRVGIGTASPTTTFAVLGSSRFNGGVTITDFLSVHGNVTFGATNVNTLAVNSTISTHLIPNTNATLDLGSPSFYWDDAYIDSLNANNIVAANTEIGGTKNESFTINSDNATVDTEDSTLIFYRGTVTPNALLRWNSTADRFELSQKLQIQDETPATGATLLSLKAGGGQGGTNLFELQNSSGNYLSIFTAAGGYLSNIASTTALVIQNGSGVNQFVVDSTNGSVTIAGTASITGGATFNSATTTDSLYVGGVTQLTGATASSTGLVLGTDVNLHRSAANTLNLRGHLISATDNAYDLGASGATRFRTGYFGTSVIVGSTITITTNTINSSGALSLNTTNNQAITTGTGLFTTGGALTVTTGLNANSATTTDSLRAGGLFTTAGNVGIAGFSSTSAPTSTLAVAGGLHIQKTTSLDSSLFVHPTTGNVGIGTTGPGELLDVRGFGNIFGIKFDKAEIGTGFTSYSQAQGGIIGSSNAGGSYPFNLNGNLLIASRTNGTARDIVFATGATPTERMVIQGAGNVGIGTTSPSDKLHVAGRGIFDTRVVIGSTTNAGAGMTDTSIYMGTDLYATYFMDSVTSGSVIYGRRASTSQAARSNVSNGQGLFDIRSAGFSGATGYWDTAKISFVVDGTVTDNQRPPSRIAFYTNTDNGAVTEQVRIDKSGNVGIGTTTPGALLEISKATAPSLRISNLRDSGAFAQNEVMNTLEFYTGDPTSARVAASIAHISDFAGAHDTVRGALQFNVSTTGAVSEAMRITSSGNVGIGTTGPGARLDVQGGRTILKPTAEAYALGLGRSEIGNYYYLGVTNDASPHLVFSNNAGAEKVRIQDNGNVGIGTTGPTENLHILANSDGIGFRLQRDAATTGSYTQSINTSGDWSLAETGVAARITVLKTTGNVGIGTTGPSTLLDLEKASAEGQFTMESTTGTNGVWGTFTNTGGTFVFGRERSTGGGAITGSSGYDGLVAVSGAYKLHFGTNGAIRQTIDSSGNVGIGTTGPSSSASRTLHIYHSGSAGITLENSVNKWSHFVQGTTGSYGFYDETNSKYRLAINTSGDVGLGGQLSNLSTMAGASLVAKANGNVGIGTTAPNLRLDVEQTENTALVNTTFWNHTFGGMQIRNPSATLNTVAGIEFVPGTDAVVGIGGVQEASNLGALVFATGGGGVASTVPERMRITSGGNVGIGTTAPTRKLHVSGTGGPIIAVDGTTTPSYSLDISGAQQAFITYQSTYLRISGTGGMRLLAENDDTKGITIAGTTGNVGIGTTGPLAPLYVAGAQAAASTTANAGIVDIKASGGQTLSIGGASASPYGLWLQTKVSDNSGTTYPLVLNPIGGNVGIGTTSPGKAFEVSAVGNTNGGRVKCDTGAANCSFSIQNTGTGGSDWALTSTGAGHGLGNGKLFFGNAGASSANVTFDSSGNVGIGTTAPGQKLEIRGSGTTTGLRLVTTGVNSSGFDLIPNQGDNTHGFGIYDNNATAYRLSIDGSGNVGIGTTAPGVKLQVTAGTGEAFTSILHGSRSAALNGIKISNTDTTGGAMLALGEDTGTSATPLFIGRYGSTHATKALAVEINNTANAALSLWTNNTERVTVLAGGNVGIGTTGPGYKLVVSGSTDSKQLQLLSDSSTTGPAIWFDATGVTNGVTYALYSGGSGNSGGAGVFSIWDGTADRFTIKSGNVGIGTTAPASILHIRTDDLSPILQTTSGTNKRMTLFFRDSAGTQTARIGADISGANDDDLQFIAGSGSTPMLHIEADGNVGIGTASPQQKLDVLGSIAAGTQTDGVIMRLNGTVGELLGINTTAGAFNDLHIRSSATGIYLNTSGNVGIGTTAPTRKLHVSGTGGPIIAVDGTTTPSYSLDISGAQQAFITYQSTYLRISGTGGMRLLAENDDTKGITIAGTTGNVGIGTTAPAYQLQLSTDSAAKPTSNTWTIASDLRVKTDITPFGDGLDILKQINPVNYVLNGKGGMPLGARGIGVIAQDVKDIIPYTIGTYKAKLSPADSAETDLYSFNSSALTFVAINAIKELDAKVMKFAQANQWQMDSEGYLVVEKLKVKNLKIAGKTAGLGLIKPGELQALVVNENVKETSQVIITFRSDLAGRSYYVSAIDPGNSFTVTLSSLAPDNLYFSYWIVDSDNSLPEFIDAQSPAAPPAAAPAVSSSPLPNPPPSAQGGSASGGQGEGNGGGEIVPAPETETQTP